MGVLVLFLIALVIMGSLSFVVISAKNPKNEIEQENKILEFKTFTSAVCEHSKNVVNCKDEVFVKCNETITKAADVAECGGIKIGIPEATGAATFSEDWKDPRV